MITIAENFIIFGDESPGRIIGGKAVIKVIRYRSSLKGILENMRFAETAAVERKLSGGLIVRYFPKGFKEINQPEKFMIGRIGVWPSVQELAMVAVRLEEITGGRLDDSNWESKKIGGVFWIEIPLI